MQSKRPSEFPEGPYVIERSLETQLKFQRGGVSVPERSALLTAEGPRREFVGPPLLSCLMNGIRERHNDGHRDRVCVQETDACQR